MTKTEDTKTFEKKSKVSVEQHNKAVDNLRMNAMEVSFEISRLPTSRKVSADQKIVMTSAVEGKARGFSVGKRIFDCTHPAVQELNQSIRKLEQYRDAFTIVKAANLIESGAEGKPEIEPGKRLIRRQDIDEFDAGICLRSEHVYAAAEKVQKALPDIKKMDKERLGKAWDDADYPANVCQVVKVTIPTYSEYTVSVNLPKKIYERELVRLRATLNGTLETAVTYLCTTLTESFTMLAKQLVNRTRITPRKGHPLEQYTGAEVVQVKKVGHPLGSPTDMVALQIRFKTPDPKQPGKEKSEIIWLDPMAEEEYHTNLRPSSTDEKKKISSSVVEHIMEELGQFTKIKSMLSEYGTDMDISLDKIRDILSTAGSGMSLTADHVTEEIKNAASFRNALAKTLDEVVSELAETAVEVKATRRKISANLVGKV